MNDLMEFQNLFDKGYRKCPGCCHENRVAVLYSTRRILGLKAKFAQTTLKRDALDFQCGMQVFIAISGTQPRCS